MLISLRLDANRRPRVTPAANLNVGNDRQLLLAVITQLLPFIGYPRTLNALPRDQRGVSASVITISTSNGGPNRLIRRGGHAQCFAVPDN